MRVPALELGGARTLLSVPMLKESKLVGVISIYRTEVRPFTEKQIELVANFAAQAVIAIENARLLNELRQRTNDLTESLEQQTATSEVLRVISSSPGDLQPVFTAMLANATRICEAKFGNLLLREEGAFRAVAWHGEPTYVENWRCEPLVMVTDDSRIPLARLIQSKQPVHVADLRTEPAYGAGFVPLVTLVDKVRARTLLIVPMLKEHSLVGAIAVYRQEVRPFTEKQIALITNFAAQAVIAIENTRLLNELRRICFSSRPPPPTCSRLSAARPSICKRFLTLLLNQQHGFAKPIWRRLIGKKAMLIGRPHRMAIRQNCRPIWRAIQFRQGTARLSAALSGTAEPFTFTMFWLIRTTK